MNYIQIQNESTAKLQKRPIKDFMLKVLEALGKEVFSASQMGDKPAETLLKTDFKEFHLGDHRIGISQVTTMDSERMMRRIDELSERMSKLREEKAYDMYLLMITDVLKEGTELVYIGERENIRQAFGLDDAGDGHVFLPGVVSRKKQVVPALAVLWG